MYLCMLSYPAARPAATAGYSPCQSNWLSEVMVKSASGAPSGPSAVHPSPRIHTVRQPTALAGAMSFE